MDIFKQLQSDVTELTEFCLESPRRPLSSSSYTKVLSSAGHTLSRAEFGHSSRPTSSSDLDRSLQPVTGEPSKASLESSRASGGSSQASTLTSSKEELPRLEPFEESLFQMKPISRRGPDSSQIKPTSRGVTSSSQAKHTSSRDTESLPQSKPASSNGTHSLSQIKPSSNGSDSLLGTEEVDTSASLQPGKAESRGGLKGSCSVGKLAGSPSITKLQEETGSNISRNSSIDSGIQFASDPETNGVGGPGLEPSASSENDLEGLSLADEIFSTLGLLGTQS